MEWSLCCILGGQLGNLVRDLNHLTLCKHYIAIIYIYILGKAASHSHHLVFFICFGWMLLFTLKSGSCYNLHIIVNIVDENKMHMVLN